MALHHLNTRLVPIHCTGSSLGSCLKSARTRGLNQKKLVLLSKSALCCICHGLGKALSSWMREQYATSCKRHWPPPRVSLHILPLVQFGDRSEGSKRETEGAIALGPQTHPFYPVCIYLAFRAWTGCSSCEKQNASLRNSYSTCSRFACPINPPANINF